MIMILILSILLNGVGYAGSSDSSRAVAAQLGYYVSMLVSLNLAENHSLILLNFYLQKIIFELLNKLDFQPLK